LEHWLKACFSPADRSFLPAVAGPGSMDAATKLPPCELQRRSTQPFVVLTLKFYHFLGLVAKPQQLLTTQALPYFATQRHNFCKQDMANL
jgi:hypothetical protein